MSEFYIETQRCVLRPPRRGEGPIYRQAIEENFEALKATMTWAQSLASLEDCERFIGQAADNWKTLQCEGPAGLTLFLWDADQTTFLGSTGYRNVDGSVPFLEIGYWLDKNAQGQGLMTEAADALTQYALDVFKAQRIEICCAASNLRSKKIPERLGYTLEARLKNKLFDFKAQQPVDQLVYACFPG